MVPRKSALTAKIDAMVVECKNDPAILNAKLEEIDKAVIEANQTYDIRLAEKTKTLEQNVKYYGGKTQELIQELLIRQPFDMDSGMPFTLASTIKKLGIDTDKIRFSFKTEEFTDF